MHFDAGQPVVPDRTVAEMPCRNVAAKLAVDPLSRLRLNAAVMPCASS
jgi:hypothetical protein